jgi:hypothetical protein
MYAQGLILPLSWAILPGRGPERKSLLLKPQ